MTRSLYDAAIADFTKALESLVPETRAYCMTGLQLTQKDEQHLALADLNAVLRVRPDSARALSLRGIARFNLGQVTQASEDFRNPLLQIRMMPWYGITKDFFTIKLTSMMSL